MIGKRDHDGKKKTRIRLLLDRVPAKTKEVCTKVLRGNLGVKTPTKPPEIDCLDLSSIRQNVEKRDLSPEEVKEKRRLDHLAELYIRRVDCKKPKYLGDDR